VSGARFATVQRSKAWSRLQCVGATPCATLAEDASFLHQERAPDKVEIILSPKGDAGL
jgi:hypothetical protein